MRGHRDYGVGSVGGLARSLTEARTSVLERYRLGSGAVVDEQIMAGGEQSLRHPETHIPKTDEGDARH